MAEIKIDVTVATKQAEERIKKLQQIMEQVGDDISNKEKQDILSVMSQLEGFSQRSTNLIGKIQSNLENIEIAKGLQKELDVVSKNLEEFMEAPLGATAEGRSVLDLIIEAQGEIDRLQSKLEELNAEKLIAQNERWNQQLATSDASLHRILGKSHKLEDDLSGSNQKTKSLDRSAKSADSSFKRMRTSTKGMSTNLSGGLKSIIRYGLALFSIRSIYSALSKLSRQWLDSNDEGARQLKSNINAMSSALSNALAPVLTYLGNLMATVMGYANALLKAFFGIDLFAKKTGKNVSKGIGGGMKKANKEMKKFTAGFDEAEVMSSDIADNLDGTGGGGGGLDELPEPKIPAPDISKFMEAVDKMKVALLGIWNSKEVKKHLNYWVRIASVTFESIKLVGANLWDNIVDGWNLMLPNLIEGFNSLVSLHAKMVSDMADTLEKWLPSITEKVNQFVDDIYSTFSPLFLLISEIWRDTWQIAEDLWDKYGAVLLDKIGEFIDNTIEIFRLIWTSIIDPIIAPALDFMSDLWHDHIKAWVTELLSFVSELAIVALDIYNKFIAPIAKFLLETLQPIFSVVFGTILGVVKGVLGSMIDSVTNYIRTLRGVFQGLIDFITGVFTFKWAKAWQGLKDIFSSIVSGLGNIFKIPINIIIDGINGFIRGINRIKIPTWVPGVGGKGFSIAQIPRLAEGAVLTQPTLNIAGEYPNARRNPEIVTPENKMREAMEDVLSRYGGGLNGTIVVQSILDGRVLSETVIDREELKNLQLNGGVV